MWIDHTLPPEPAEIQTTTMKQKQKQAKSSTLSLPIKQMPAEQYHARPELNVSSLKLFMKSPLRYYQQRNGMHEQVTTKAMEQGSIWHSFLLEDREDFYTAPATYPGKDGMKPWNWSANYCKTWAADHSDKTILTQAELTQLLNAKQVLYHDKYSSNVLKHMTHYEGSVFAYWKGFDWRIRMDGYGEGTIVDLKTCADAHPDEVKRTVLKFQYHIQAYVYTEVAKAAGIPVDRFVFLFLEKSDPALLYVCELEPAWYEHAKQAVDDALEKLTLYKNLGTWPSYSQQYSEHGLVPTLKAPNWMMTDAVTELSIQGEKFLMED